MENLFHPTGYYIVLTSMAVMAVIVFFALHRINAGYGMMGGSKWGPAINNRLGWFIMELPAFAGMAVIWALSPRGGEPAPCVMAALFELHYFQRTFIFPFLIRGKNRMPWAIICMGMVFNAINAYMIGGWLFYLSPADLYQPSWLLSPLFFMGTFIFLVGIGINLHSDHVIRSLRQPGDSRHYIPMKGCYRFVASANYFGETVEWIGYAILTWSLAGVVFALWTFANLAPRAKAIHKKYCDEFGPDYSSLGRRYIIPFLY